MAYQHGAAGGVWKPGARATAVFGRALDLVFPPQALDGTARPQSSGLSAEAWSRIRLIAEPACDGCGAPFEYDLGERCAACLARPRAGAAQGGRQRGGPRRRSQGARDADRLYMMLSIL